MTGYPATTSSEPASRRRLLRLIGVGGAALVATLLPRNGIRAGHDPFAADPDVLHLGQVNAADATTLLNGDFLPETGTSPVLAVLGSGQVPIGIIGSSEIGTGISGGTRNTGPGAEDDPSAGVWGVGNGDGRGVRGTSNAGDWEGLGSGTGVLGESGSGFGIEGRGESGPGVAGFSDTGPGGTFGSQGGPGIEATGGNGPGVFGRSEGNGPGGAFDSENGPGVVATSKDVGAVVGFSENGPGGSFSGNGGIGVRGFIQGSGGPGVLGAAPGEAPGVRALSAPFGGGGFPPDAGLALEVIGKARFSTAGEGTVPVGAESVEVSDAAVTAHSHITVTLTSDPSGRQVGWVETGSGKFTVHMTSAPPPQRPQTDFTYLIVEPGMP